MNPGTLRSCPTCGRKWPDDADHQLRSLAWLGDLPRRVSASNPDVMFHDGTHGRDRFLMLEVKRIGEPWQHGQEWFLRAMSRISGVTVRVLRGTLDRLTVERVTPEGIDEGRASRPDDVRKSIVAWTEGAPFTDPPRTAPFGSPIGTPRECGWCHRMHPVGTTCSSAA